MRKEVGSGCEECECICAPQTVELSKPSSNIVADPTLASSRPQTAGGTCTSRSLVARLGDCASIQCTQSIESLSRLYKDNIVGMLWDVLIIVAP